MERATPSGAVNALKLLEDFWSYLVLTGLAAADRRAAPGFLKKAAHNQRINRFLRRFPCHSSDFGDTGYRQRRVRFLQGVEKIYHAQLTQTQIGRLAGQGL